jgi:Protein of unknown function (DUF2934)
MTDETKIRERAYQLWELDGHRDGAEHDHWRQALEQLEAEEGQPTSANTLDSVGGATQSGIAEMPARQGTESAQ